MKRHMTLTLLFIFSLHSYANDVGSATKHDLIRYTPNINSLLTLSKTYSGYKLPQFYHSFYHSLYEYNNAEIHIGIIKCLKNKSEAIRTLAFMQEIKNDLNVDSHDHEEALQLDKEDREMAASLHTLSTRDEVDKLEMQKEEQERSCRNTIMCLSLALILLFVIIGITLNYIYKIKAKKRLLLNHIYGQDKLEMKYEQILSERLQDNNIPTENDENEISRELIYRLKELMKDPLVFTDPNVNRKTIAERLGTNEKYVFDIIKEYYGTNISDYIISLRLNYARNLLSLSEEKRTIESIAIDSGYNSRSVFHRHFKEYYGMTPVEFRRLTLGFKE